MTGKRWLMATGLAGLLTQAGCMTCCHTASKVGFEAGPDCPIPLCDRQKVYVVLLNGATPGGSAELDALRDALAGRGFTKVYSAQAVHAVWLEREMVRVCAEEPGARFVVVGYDFGCVPAKWLAGQGVAAGVPVDGLFYLDPVGVKETTAGDLRTVIVRSGGAAAVVPHSPAVLVSGASHFTLPSHPQTVNAVCRVLAESAARVVLPPLVEPADPGYPNAPPIFLPPTEGVPSAEDGGPLVPLEPPARVGPYGKPWPGQRDGQPLSMPRKADGSR